MADGNIYPGGSPLHWSCIVCFVQDFASVAEPLHTLTKKHTHFHWTEKCQAAFDKLKYLLTTAPVLGHPLAEGNMVLDTDTSNVGIGAVLSQIQQGRECVLAYGSRKLSKTEKNYCTTQRELLAVVDFTSHFRQYLLGRQTHGKYNFEIIHHPGRLHSNTASLSSRPCRQFCPCKLPVPSLQPVNVSDQAVQCELDSDINQKMLSPVGVEGQSVSAAVSLVGVDKAAFTDRQFNSP